MTDFEQSNGQDPAPTVQYPMPKKKRVEIGDHLEINWPMPNSGTLLLRGTIIEMQLRTRTKLGSRLKYLIKFDKLVKFDDGTDADEAWTRLLHMDYCVVQTRPTTLSRGRATLPRPRFNSYSKFAPATEKEQQALKSDCRDLYRRKGEATSWLGHSSKPRTRLEHLAKHVFNFHVKDLPASISQHANSGVEFWTQVRGSAGGEEVEDEVGGSSAHTYRASPSGLSLVHPDSIVMHWDKDEELYSEQGKFRHPYLSTVTYFTSAGAPTVVFDTGITPCGSYMYRVSTDADLEVGEADEAGVAANEPNGIATSTSTGDQSRSQSQSQSQTMALGPRVAWVSYPHPMKHIVFDGKSMSKLVVGLSVHVRVFVCVGVMCPFTARQR